MYSIFRLFLLIVLTTFFSSQQLCARKSSKPLGRYVVLSSMEGAGMFFHMTAVLGALSLYERGTLSGVEVGYGIDGKYGLYYDEKIGSNWWEYYFEPLKVGVQKGAPWITGNGKTGCFFSDITNHKLFRKQAGSMLKRHVKVKSHIQEIVDSFVAQEYGSSKVIGVHYRGTDKARETPRMSYEAMAEQIQKELERLGDADTKIFVATDEQPFVEYMKELYPSKVIFYDAAIRSTDGKPVHFNNSDPYKSGEGALVDCLLLSRCNTLVRTISYLSQISTYFNVDMPVIVVE